MNGKTRNIEELTENLKEGLRLMKRIPIDAPCIGLPTRKCLPVLGQLTSYVIEIDANQELFKETMKESTIEMKTLRKQRGKFDIVSNLQLATTPDLQVGTRIEMLFKHDGDNATDLLQWKQGAVEVFSDGENVDKETQGFYGKFFQSHGMKMKLEMSFLVGAQLKK